MTSVATDLPELTLPSGEINHLKQLLTARIVALFLEATLFGAFLVTYFVGLGELLHGNRQEMSRRNKILLGVNTLMVVLAATHVSLTIKTSLGIFVGNGGSWLREDKAANIFELLFSPTGLVQSYIYVTQTLIGDAFMVYRLFVVWNRRRAVLVVPIFLIIIDIAGGYASFLGAIFVITFFFSSFCTNLLCTVLIMWRVLAVEQVVETRSKWHSRVWYNLKRYHRVLEAIVQSAAIYSMTSIVLAITVFTTDVGYTPCLLVFPQLIGIVFSLIVIHIVRAGKAHPSSLVDKQPLPTVPALRTPIRLPELRIDDSDVGNGEKVSRISMSNDLESAGVGKEAFN